MGILSEEKIQAECTELLYLNARTSNLTVLIAALALAAIMSAFVPPAPIVVWLTLMITGVGLRLWLVHRRRRVHATAAPSVWARRYAYATAVLGLGWALMVPIGALDSTLLREVIVVVTIGITALAVPVLVSYPLAVRLYTLPVLLATCAALLAQLETASGLLGLGIALLAFLMIRASANFHAALVTGLRLGFENEALASDLRAQKSEADRLNRQLTIEIEEHHKTQRILEGHRSNLERAVAERTVELSDARDQAEAANRAKSAFLANMSHEIRTPLNAVLGYAHLLQRSPMTPEQAQRLERIDHAGRHLLSIVNDVLDLAKIEAGKLELQRSDLRCNRLLDQIKAMIAAAAEAKGVGVHVSPDTPTVCLSGDVTRLRQAVLNYASNAVKFTEHGRIDLGARIVDEDGNGPLLRFEVRDTGIGIAPETLPRLFRPFEQADSSSTRRYGGSGLGLVIARELAEMMGGEAGVESRVGTGSTFWLTARVERTGTTDAALTATIDAVEASLRQRHAGTPILLVEDEPINRTLATELLEGVGLIVHSARNGREALDLAGRGRYALVLMDLQMPVMDGISATRALRALPDWRQVPILALTANVLEEDRDACQAAGMNAVLAKPVDPDALMASLLHWLAAGVPNARAAPSASSAPSRWMHAI